MTACLVVKTIHTCSSAGRTSEIGFIRLKSRCWPSGPSWRLRGKCFLAFLVSRGPSSLAHGPFFICKGRPSHLTGGPGPGWVSKGKEVSGLEKAQGLARLFHWGTLSASDCGYSVWCQLGTQEFVERRNKCKDSSLGQQALGWCSWASVTPC